MSSEWTQVHGALRTGDLRDGLQMRIADPLWMLARQWQFGGFKGEDAASPVRVRLRHGSVPVDVIVSRGGKPAPLVGGSPTEVAAEAEAVATGPAATRRRAESGLALLRRLPERLCKAVLPPLQAAFQLDPPEQPSRVMALFLRASFDGVALREAPAARRSAVIAGMNLAQADRTLLEGAFGVWSALDAARFAEPPGDGGTWVDSRMEYAFALRAEGIEAELTADGYRGGRFDWSEVDIRSPSGKAFTAGPRASTEWLVPTRIRYSGMPARRLWDFEPGAAFFGQIDADAAELPQLILTEFATVYADDYYMVPAPVPTGSLARILEVRVVDVFGDSHEIKPAAVTDGPKRPWRFFELEGDRSAENGLSPWLYVPRIAENAHEGPALERTMMMRDEAANLAWAVELIQETGSGDRRDRRRDWFAAREALLGPEAEAPAPPPAREEDVWTYALETTVPPFWLPLAPEVRGNRATGLLLRGRMRAWDLLGTAARRHAGPQGLFMRPDGPLALHEEEIPREGLELTRHFQAARAADGRLLVWASRRRRPAGETRSSGRDTDMATDAEGRAVDAGAHSSRRRPATAPGDGA